MPGLSGRKFILLVVLAVGLIVALSMRRTETDRARNVLEELAEAVGFESGKGHETLARLSSAIQSHVAEPITVELEPTAESSVDRASLMESMMALREQLSGLTVTLKDVSVKLDRDEKRATAKGEALLTLLDAQGARRVEPHRFSVGLERGESGWVMVQARIAAPRVDQPEARP
jgi:type III secretory pathway component EscV